MAYTADDLDAAVRRRTRLRDGTQGLSQASMLEIGDEAIREDILPALLNLREEYLVARSDLTVTADQQGYRIPTRAVGQAVRDVTYIDSTGRESSLDRVPLEDVGMHTTSNGATKPWAFTVEADKILLLDTPSSTTGTLRVRYLARPGELCLQSAAFAITALPGSGVLSGAEPGWSTSDTVDVIQANPHFASLLYDGALSGVSAGASVTLSSATDPDDVAVGDWVSLAGTSPIVQLPVELHPVLVTAMSVRVHETMGDTKRMAAAQGKLEKSLRALETLLDDRVHGEEELVVEWDSPLRYGRSRAWGVGW